MSTKRSRSIKRSDKGERRVGDPDPLSPSWSPRGNGKGITRETKAINGNWRSEMAALRVGTGRRERVVSGAQAHRIKLIAHLTRCLTFPLCASRGSGRGGGAAEGTQKGSLIDTPPLARQRLVYNCALLFFTYSQDPLGGTIIAPYLRHLHLSTI